MIVPIVRPLFSGEKKLEPLRREKIEPMAGVLMEVRGERFSEDHGPVMDTFVGDLSIRYGIDKPTVMVTLSPAVLRAQNWEQDGLLKDSVQNLVRIYKRSIQVQRPKAGFGMLTGAASWNPVGSW
jgi:hypothetical protein